MISFFSKDLIGIQKDITLIAEDLQALVDKVQNAEIRNKLHEVRERIMEPFLFVIVGEVKAGKSSFINALLGSGKEVCKVAPAPMTDTIQQIVYGETEKEIIVNQYLKKIYQPVDILKEVTIVDTPGTNTIIQHHQEITENFIPGADLIVFVFEAKNPYRESSWQFFDFINDGWWKKVIFVLQQKDLLNEDDLNINRQGVIDHAKKKGILDPKVFAVSAKEELDGLKTTSGFEMLHKYIDDNILGGKAPYLKMDNNRSVLLNIAHRVSDGLKIRQLQYESDIKFREEIHSSLSRHETKSSRQVDNLIGSLIAEYDKITRPKLNEIKEGLTFGAMLSKSIKSTFGMSDSPKMWLSDLLGGLEKDLNYHLKDRLNEGVVDIADSIQEMGSVVDLKIRNSSTILNKDSEFFSEMATRRIHILRELQASFGQFLNRTENFYDESMARESSKISGNIAAASGITAVGVILAAVTHGMVFDITGGVLTGLGFLIAGVTLGLRRNKIIHGFEAELHKGKMMFEDEISKKLKHYIANIKSKINENFELFDQHLQQEKNVLSGFHSQLQSVESRLQKIGHDLKKIT